jgi:cation diffusion facilitator family transporter
MHLRAETDTWDPFPPTVDGDDAAHRHDAHRAIGVSAVGLAATGLIELIIAVFSGSVGLLSDALHNLSDVSTSAIVFAGFRISKRPANSSHTYGYERAEDLAGLGIALVIWASAVLAGVVSVHKLTTHGHTTHLGFGMAAAVVGIIGNQVVARYKRRVGQRIDSATLVADAQHSWLDALSSMGAFVGLALVAVGWPWADAVAGIVVTGFIVHVGWDVTRELLKHLSDGVDPQIVATAERAAGAVAGVEHAHVRARWMGRSLVIEVEGFVAPGTAIEQAEVVGRHVEVAVSGAVSNCRAVLWAPRAMPMTTSQR